MFRHRPGRAKHGVLCIAVLLAVLGGCSNTPEKPANERLSRSLELSQQGQSAYQRGDAAAAAGFFQGALQLNLSIENQAGVVAGRINLSQALEAAGDVPAARRQLEGLLGDTSLHLGAEQRARAYATLALLALKHGQAEEGERMIGAARLACAEACPSLAAILNIRARFELERSDPASALASATAALAMLTAADQLVERANASRLIGQARLARGETITAIEILQQALTLDRELGKPERIVDDLLLLGRAYAISGHAANAADFQRRAMTVAEAAADPALINRVSEFQRIRRPQ